MAAIICLIGGLIFRVQLGLERFDYWLHSLHHLKR